LFASQIGAAQESAEASWISQP